ncbi:MAG: prolyl oligopeptidase family serine peptidase [Acidobacteriota bacterium]|nr:prolyl oligopeptidase family serine peptidase [Acidobacteriota bacterium]
MRKTLVLVGFACLSTALLAQQSQPSPSSGYLMPPRPTVDILDAAPPPTVELSASGRAMAVLERSSMPSIAELAQPMLRLAGVRINPKTNGLHRAVRYRSLVLRNPDDGTERKVTLPPSPAIGWIGFSPDSARFAFTQTGDNGIELWVGDTATGAAKALTPAQLNNALGSTQRPSACQWVGQGASLLCAFTAAGRGQPPAPPTVPSGPNIQENRGVTAPVRTYQDLLASAYDEALFEYYATSQLALVNAISGARTPVGGPGIFHAVAPSPDGNFVLLARVQQPFSRLVPYDDFPTSVEVWDRAGSLVRQIADLPVADTVPTGGVLPGPRAWQWQPAQPATLVWAEALDGGDPKAKVPHRDTVMTLSAPFAGAPAELAKTEWRTTRVAWTDAGVMMLTENDRDTRMTRTWLIDAPGAAPRKMVERSQEDSYANPGTPLSRTMGSGTDAVRQVGDAIYLTGTGSTPDGDRPFLDRMNVKTLQKERIFQSSGESYETVVGLITTDAARIVTRHESRTDAPNIYARDVKANERVALTSYADPAPPLKGAKAEMVTYQRKDGVQLRATIYTPPGWTPAQGPLPALLWAYPREFTDPRTASQVTGSPFRFTTPGWSTLHLLFLLQGYAVIDDATMPIVGTGETANDTYVEQLVASAQAAVDKAAAMGVVDPERVVVGGHSYGAFMTANLLANSDIFRAGIARSGAYNRTLTPFGFQNERRTFWEVPEVYMRMSPFASAHKINEPILLIHGEADDNSGTFPIQSERLYVALKGHGATVRYVTLPHEAHGYQARESVLHTVAEMLNWADEWVKNAKPRDGTSQRR